MITELPCVNLRDQARPSDAAWNRPRWKGSGGDALFAVAASILGTYVNVSL
jgi:hypothetical protein